MKRPSAAALVAAAGMGMMAMSAVNVPQPSAGSTEARTSTDAQRQQPQRNEAQQLRDQQALRQAWAKRRATRRGWPGLGWSVAEDRRRAKKRRNVKRNRAAVNHKGRRHR